MSGNRNSGRRPASVARPDFAAAAESRASARLKPELSTPAAKHWKKVVDEARLLGSVVLSRDAAVLGRICEQLAVMDAVRKAKSAKSFSPLSDKGLRVLRVERQATKEIDRLWRAAQRDIESRARRGTVPHGPTSSAPATAVPSIRDFASRRSSSSG